MGLNLEGLLFMATFVVGPAAIVSWPAAWACLRCRRNAESAAGASLGAGMLAGPAAVVLAAIILMIADGFGDFPFWHGFGEIILGVFGLLVVAALGGARSGWSSAPPSSH